MTTPSNSAKPVQDSKLLVSAYFDGELDPADAASVRQRIEADPALANQFANYAALREALRKRLSAEQVTPAQLAQINNAISARRWAPPAWARPAWIRLAASILVALALSGGLAWVYLRAQEPLLASEQIAFPRDLGILYSTLENDGQLREMYVNQIALDAAKAGKPLPSGTILVRNIYEVVRDHDGTPAKNAEGRLTKSKLLSVNVMEKRTGWGGRHSAGEWDFQSFAADGTRNAKPSASDCFACHQKAQAQDFVFGLDRIRAAASIWRTMFAALRPR